MLNEERRRKIVEITNERKSVSINELTELLDSSHSTIRRDLSILSKNQLLRKVHGGAVSLDSGILTQDDSVIERQDLNIQNKKAIAKYAASLIKDSDVVYIDAGTTTGEMLPHLKNIKATYITNCVSHAKVLCSYGHKVFVPGGFLKSKTEALIGSDTYQYIENMNFTIGFFGANGISLKEGYTTPDPEEGEIKRIACSHTGDAYILADSSKFNVICTYTYAKIDRGSIITDPGAPKAYKELYNTIVADPLEGISQ
ncbi:MAG: DeoR/GlpR family DNA-binding transcription regulator [Solobacterium sp.]|nr:DeoR/GlpR family DNA-binding transcription regulator [Solobacterium sp.]